MLFTDAGFVWDGDLEVELLVFDHSIPNDSLQILRPDFSERFAYHWHNGFPPC